MLASQLQHNVIIHGQLSSISMVDFGGKKHDARAAGQSQLSGKLLSAFMVPGNAFVGIKYGLNCVVCSHEHCQVCISQAK